jgi:hypothetical protein
MTGRIARPIVRAVVASGLVAASAFGAVSAQAAETSATPKPVTATASCAPATLAGWKVVVGERIQRRLDALHRMSTRLDAASHVTSEHRSSLRSIYATDTSGLTALNTQLQGETTCSAVRADAKAVVHDYFVFALVGPQSGLTVAADTGLYGADRLAAAEPAIRKAIALLPPGATRTAAHASYDDLVAQVTRASADFSGVADAVLTLTPATFPTRTGVLTTQLSRVASGGKALGRAVQDARALQADFGGRTS